MIKFFVLLFFSFIVVHKGDSALTYFYEDCSSAPHMRPVVKAVNNLNAAMERFVNQCRTGRVDRSQIAALDKVMVNVESALRVASGFNGQNVNKEFHEQQASFYEERLRWLTTYQGGLAKKSQSSAPLNDAIEQMEASYKYWATRYERIENDSQFGLPTDFVSLLRRLMRRPNVGIAFLGGSSFMLSLSADQYPFMAYVMSRLIRASEAVMLVEYNLATPLQRHWASCDRNFANTFQRPGLNAAIRVKRGPQDFGITLAGDNEEALWKSISPVAQRFINTALSSENYAVFSENVAGFRDVNNPHGLFSPSRKEDLFEVAETIQSSPDERWFLANLDEMFREKYALNNQVAAIRSRRSSDD